MSDNPVERSVNPLISQVDLTKVGLAKYEGSLPVTLYPLSVIGPLLATLIAKNTAYRAACEAEKSAHGELRRAATPAREFVTVLVNVFRPVLGQTWNRSWEQLGFLKPSLAQPTSYSDLQGVLLATKDYLTTHAAAEVPSRGVTKVIATGHYDAVKDGLANITSCEEDTKTCRQEFDPAMSAMQDGVSGLIGELTLRLSPTDPRWKAFGLNIPGYPAVPEQVLNLIVTPQLAGTLLLNWDASARFARNLVEMQLMAPDAEWTLMTTVAETTATLTGLTPGANVLLRVTAANDGGEGVPSEPVQAKVPLALAA